MKSASVHFNTPPGLMHFMVLPNRRTRFRSASHGIGFVNKSAGFSFDGVYSKLMSPNLMCSFVVSDIYVLCSPMSLPIYCIGNRPRVVSVYRYLCLCG